ncbi:MAG: UDP-N-acetylmuramate dehydrogenase [Desulfobacterales bacterium]|nr:UDP-N-acetylmuramate dehydrogenase [Desulfobacterales bacterium]
MINKSDKNWLTEHFGAHVLFNEPMWRHTTFRIGGPVDALITVKTQQEIKDLAVWARDRGHPIMILGAGSNLLVRDGGVRGLVLKLADDFEAIHLSPRINGSSAMITAGAAVLVRRLGKYALDQRLAGLNFALGIPGAVGGALRMNAGAWGGCMADITCSIRVLNRYGDISRMIRDQLRFSYRGLDLEKGTIILSGQFELRHGDREALQKEAIRMQQKRRLSQPLSLPSAGSVFRNPPGQKAAGKLIDQAGLKGLRVGEAEVSTKHANFIVNKGHARASDVLDLIRQIQETVLKRFGVNLDPEVTIVGQKAGS